MRWMSCVWLLVRLRRFGMSFDSFRPSSREVMHLERYERGYKTLCRVYGSLFDTV